MRQFSGNVANNSGHIRLVDPSMYSTENPQENLNYGMIVIYENKLLKVTQISCVDLDRRS